MSWWRQRRERRRGKRRGQRAGGDVAQGQPANASAGAVAQPGLRELIEVCFLAMGKPTQVDYAVSIIRNIEAHAAADVRYHMLVDKPPAPLTAQMREREVWRGLPMERVRLQSIADMSGSARRLYRALSATATGPGGLLSLRQELGK